MDMKKPAFLPASRRAVIAGALAVPFLHIRGSLAAERCVVGTWGGDYAHLLAENIDTPILKPTGMDIVQAVGDEAPRMAQLTAQKALPHGTLDIACVGAPNGYRAAAAGLLETLDETKVPNLKHVPPLLRSGSFMPNQFVPHIYSAQVLAYNPQTVKDPPKTFTELLDPRWKGKVGVISTLGSWLLMGAALAVGSSSDDFDKGKDYFLKLNANGLRLYAETDAIGPAFKSGEIEIAIVWQARTVMWQNAGVPIQGLMPDEGAIVYVSGMILPKNAPDKDAAYKYMNALLEPSAQQGFAAHMGYLPTVDNAPLAGKVAEQLTLPQGAKLVQPDYAKVATIQPELNDWWLKNIQHT
jgi:putative spermidine/putrescine transport system substrate-binding protein